VRRTFAETLAELAAEDPRILLLTGDLGYMALDPFSDRHQDRFLNVGVAEQNMVGLATGLAEAGFFPFIYSIATFASMRAYEFIRNGPILHGLPVRIIGVGGGFEYGPAGPTHHGLEDLGVMRLQPGLTLIAPADHAQAKTALLTTWDREGPVYYRLGKDDRSTVPGLEGRFEIGGAHTVREGRDLLMVATGAIAKEAVEAAEVLGSEGIDCGVMVVASLHPAPSDPLAEALADYATVLSVEAHYVTGGLGSWMSEVIAERGLRCRLFRCGVEDTPDSLTGGQKYLQHRHGLSKEALADRARQALSK
jgi:transketolase